MSTSCLMLKTKYNLEKPQRQRCCVHLNRENKVQEEHKLYLPFHIHD